MSWFLSALAESPKYMCLFRVYVSIWIVNVAIFLTGGSWVASWTWTLQWHNKKKLLYLPPRQSLFPFSSFGVVALQFPNEECIWLSAANDAWLLYRNTLSVHILWRHMSAPCQVELHVSSGLLISLSLPFTDLADKPSTSRIVPYSSWHPVIPFIATPNLNRGPEDDAIWSAFSKWAILFILSD